MGLARPRYLPFVRDGGRFQTEMVAYRLGENPDGIPGEEAPFLADARRTAYAEAKTRVLSAHPCAAPLVDRCSDAVLEGVRQRILAEHPDRASRDLSAWSLDELVRSLQEDVAIVAVEAGSDRLAYAHVCLPSRWRPEDKIGRPLGAIHHDVPHMQALNARAGRFVQGVAAGDRAWVRFVWGLQTDDGLDQHPDRSVRRPFSVEEGNLWVRVERQVLLPVAGALLFLIRPYVDPVAALDGDARLALWQATLAMGPAVREYKGIAADHEAIRRYLLGG